MIRPATDFRGLAHDGWGTPPDYILALAEACGRESQAAVARRLGVSASMLSQALRRRYPGDMARLEELIRAALMGETVQCPELGEIVRSRCLSVQIRPLSSSSPLALRLHRACRACPHSRQAKDRP